MMDGWIRLHRKICLHPFYKERRVFSHLEAWLDLLLLANHKDHKFLLGSIMIEAQRGEVVTSDLKLMERWRWSKAKVRRFIACLVDENMVIKKADSKKTSLFIINYDTYQGDETAEKPQKNCEETADDTQSIMKRMKKKITQRDSDPRVKEFIDFWYLAFQEKFGQPYRVEGGKDGARVKSLLKSSPLDRLKELAGLFFKSRDSFIQKSGYTIGAFSSQINKLVVEETQRRSQW